MGRPVIHAAAWLARRIEQNRLEPRVRRMLNKLHRDLHAQPWRMLRALTHGRLARRELLIQQREAHLLKNADAEGGKWLLGLWAAQRRDIELLALLERLGDPADQPPRLEDYLKRYDTDAANDHAAPATPLPVPETPTPSLDAVSEAVGSQEPTP